MSGPCQPNPLANTIPGQPGPDRESAGIEREVLVDARGLRCPMPVIRLARAAAGLEPGSLLRVLADDPAARHDIPAWARIKGHRVDAGGPGQEDTFRVILGQPKSS